MARPLSRCHQAILERFDEFDSDLVGWLEFFENPINEVNQRHLDDLKEDIDQLRDWLHEEEVRPSGVRKGLDEQVRCLENAVTAGSEDLASDTGNKEHYRSNDIDDSLNSIRQIARHLSRHGTSTEDPRYIRVHLLKLREFVTREKERRFEKQGHRKEDLLVVPGYGYQNGRSRTS